MIMSTSYKVCVIGGAGYIGSWLVKQLLEKGYTVHATLRNLDDVSKVSLLKSLPDADARLVLFEADIYNPIEFEHAIEGFKNITEAAIAGAKSIAECCLKSGTVKRLIYTSSVVAASPLKDDGSGFGNLVDETCWTPLSLSFACSNGHREAYVDSKTLAEREILSYGNQKNGGLEVVTLACGLVGGDALLPFTSSSVAVFISQLTNSATEYQTLRFLEELVGKIPIVHIHDVCDAHIFCMEKPSISGRFLEELVGKIPIVHIHDVCDAHIFCMEKPSISGRFLCASSYFSTAEIATYYQQNYPIFQLKPEYLDGPKREIVWGSTKLEEKGFEYKYCTKMILDDCIRCARNRGGTDFQ